MPIDKQQKRFLLLHRRPGESKSNRFVFRDGELHNIISSGTRCKIKEGDLRLH